MIANRTPLPAAGFPTQLPSHCRTLAYYTRNVTDTTSSRANHTSREVTKFLRISSLPEKMFSISLSPSLSPTLLLSFRSENTFTRTSENSFSSSDHIVALLLRKVSTPREAKRESCRIAAMKKRLSQLSIVNCLVCQFARNDVWSKSQSLITHDAQWIET